MAYDDTKWGGFAKIIVDTSTLTAGDTVRVRSMTDANAIYDKTVVTAGTPLLFETEIFKDYVKICTVQEIGGVATEIGGVYKTVDYGQTLFIDLLDKTTLQGIQGILNSHIENYALNIGDEVTIKINEGGTPKDWVMQVAGIDLYDSHEVILISKYLWDTSVWHTATNADIAYANATIRTKVTSFYDLIVDSGKSNIKKLAKKGTTATAGTTNLVSFEDYVWIPNLKEATGQIVLAVDAIQFPIFVAQNNRIRYTEGGNAQAWWTCDGNGGYAQRAARNIGTDGTSTINLVNASLYILPCFRLTADS